MDIAISRIHFPVTALGPGKRLGIWFQGCSIRCPGCISVDTWAKGKGRTTLAHLLSGIDLWLPQADGVTISGGEPFDQPDALLGLLRALRDRTRADILVYSGYSAETLAPILANADGLIDVLISDPFRLDAPHSYPLRGSDNQRVHLLTDAGRQRFAQYDRLLAPQDKKLDVMFDADGAVWLAGIPGRGDLERLKHLLDIGGHAVHISAHRARNRQDEECR